MSNPLKYNNIAIILHWLIALAIILQLCGGIWMVGAIKNPDTQKIAYNIYQYHKAIGLSILVLSLFRLFWRLTHKVPDLPQNMQNWEKTAAHFAHISLYFLMILIPLLGWATVSTSPYGFPTMFFNLFEWPHLTFLDNTNNKLYGLGHKYMSYLIILLLLAHIGAALKHQFITKDNLIKRMVPYTSRS